jgi:hypothetical protein
MRKRLIVQGLLALVILTGVLVGCGGNAGQETNQMDVGAPEGKAVALVFTTPT